LAAGVVLAAALAGHAVAQTSSTTSSPPAHASTSKHTAAHKKVASGTAPKAGAKAGTATKTGKHVPVLVPRHAGSPRQATPATAAASKHQVVKPAGKTARKVKEAPPPAPAKAAAPKKPAAPPVDPSIGTNTGLHLPRYASLKSDDVNMRVGPAERYPAIWTYKRRELPVKIEREFDIWRLVEDMDGVKGWVHQATLTGRRTFVITGTEDRTLRADASETADPVAVLKPGVVGRIKSCEAGKAWCQVQVQDYRGWLQRSDMWGVDADEVVTP
jgi:SH3-like domain-containing protein